MSAISTAIYEDLGLTDALAPLRENEMFREALE
jgi:hypothetical protein